MPDLGALFWLKCVAANIGYAAAMAALLAVMSVVTRSKFVLHDDYFAVSFGLFRLQLGGTEVMSTIAVIVSLTVFDVFLTRPTGILGQLFAMLVPWLIGAPIAVILSRLVTRKLQQLMDRERAAAGPVGEAAVARQATFD